METDEERMTVAKSILHMIDGHMNRFSKGQKRIAGYILEHYNEAASMTASRLGKLVGVSESTVVRFASELGYDGYPSMQRALQEMIRGRLTSTQRIQAAGSQILTSCGRWLARQTAKPLTTLWTASKGRGISIFWVPDPLLL